MIDRSTEMKPTSNRIKTEKLNILEIYNKTLEKFENEFKEPSTFLNAMKTRFSKDDSTKKLFSRDFKRKMAPETITAKYLFFLFDQIGINTYDLDYEWDIETKDLRGTTIHSRVDLVIPRGMGEEKGLLIEIEPIGKNLYEDKSGLYQVENWFRLDPSLNDKYFGLATNFVDWFFYDPIKRKVVQESPKNAIRKIFDIYSGERIIIKTQERVELFYLEFQRILNDIKQSLTNKRPKVLGLPKEMSIEEKERIVVTFYRTIFSRMIFLRILFDWRLLEFNIDEIFQLDESLYKNAFDQLFFRILNLPIEERPPDVLHIFKKLPYLNGGLFRQSEIELDPKTSNIRLIPDAYKMIWQMLSRYTFFDRRDNKVIDNEYIIDPEVLGNVFEKTVPTRKETGSYYTRDEITKLMASNTVNRILLNKLNKITKAKKLGLKFQSLDIRYLGDEMKTIDGEEKSVKRFLAESILKDLKKLKICDNAIGSGAFLIAISEELINIYKTMYKILNYRLPHYRDEIDTSSHPLAFSNIYDIKHHILQNNLYGVDIQKEAVELCELRLWLWLVRPPIDIKPSKYKLEALPNIDYNIRQGNSLIGYSDLSLFKRKTVKPKKGKDLVPVDTFFDKDVKIFQNDINNYYNSSFTKKKVIQNLAKKKKELYDILNLKFYNEISSVISSVESFNKLKPFHWIVDFYPVIFDGGFDAIIGNPPYIRGESVKHLTDSINVEYKNVLKKIYTKYKISSTSDLAMYFIIRSLELTKKNGFNTYIITDKWIHSSYGKNIRSYLSKNTSLSNITILADVINVFVGIAVVTMIYTLKKRPPTEDHRFFYSKPKSFDNLGNNGYFLPQSTLSEDIWNFPDPTTNLILDYIKKVGSALENFDINIKSGIKTGANFAFVINEEEKEKIKKNTLSEMNIIKPVMGGDEIERYDAKWNENWLILFPLGFTNSLKEKGEDGEKWLIKTYPLIYRHLEQFKKMQTKRKIKGLINRVDQGEYWWELRACSYYEEFVKENIVWQEISQEGRFSWENGIYLLNSAYIMGNSQKYMLLILNSELIDFYFSFISPKLINPRRRYTKQYVEKIFIRKPKKVNITYFEILVDYLMFCKKSKKLDLYNNLMKLANATVFELYFLEKFVVDRSYITENKGVIINELKRLLKPIEYEKWIKLFYKQKIYNINVNENKKFLELENQNLVVIKEVVSEIFQSNIIIKTIEIIDNHEWIQTIRNNPWIKMIKSEKE